MRVYTVKKIPLLTRLFWLVMILAGLSMTARALWSFSLPSGVLAHKLVGSWFFLICTAYSLYHLMRDRIPGRSVLHSEKFAAMSDGIICVTFGVAACVLLATGAFEAGRERLGAVVVIACFGFGGLYLFREAWRS